MHKFKLFLTTLFILGLVAACGDATEDNPSAVNSALSIDLELPDSLTGGRPSLRPSETANRSDVPCAYLGPVDQDDPFRNGYQTTRFMISTMATWTCIADFLIEIAAIVDPHDGSMIETDNDLQAANYDPEDPTHFSITDDSNSQVTVKMFYGFDRANPPTDLDRPSFYISWNESLNGNIEGRMIVETNAIDNNLEADEPGQMRLDFDFDDNQRQADMFLRFQENNEWADGFRIQVSKNLQASPLGQVFTARGLINMTSQFFASAGTVESPDIAFYTVSDLIGNGAAIQQVYNFSLPIPLNENLNNHLGEYLFDKLDLYYFEEDGDWEYINKSIINSEYLGSRTTPASGGSWVPFDPSLDLIITALDLPSDSFTNDKCAEIGDNCDELINAIFGDGFADQEQNQGTDPQDWRSTALANADYLESVFPNGTDWEGAFDQSFTPSN